MDQKKKITVWFYALVIIIPVMAFAIVNWYQNNKEALPYFSSSAAVDGADGKHFTVPGFRFTDQDNQPLDQSFIKGKVWVANYFFTSCPAICPRMMHNLKTVQDALKNDDDLKIISFTVDPDRDSAGKLNAYAKMLKIDTRQWKLATGTKPDLYRFARKGLSLVATDGNGGPDDFIHSDKLVLMDEDNHIRGYYDGTSDREVGQLIKDIKRLQ